MEGVDLIRRYFPGLSPRQEERFSALGPLYADWNERVNLVSRKDIDQLYERHVLHSLGIAKVHRFDAGTRVVDVGTGGGFPLVPLAILFPDSTFHGIDSIGKKIGAVQDVVGALCLENCSAEQVRSEDHKRKYDFIISRAVTALPEFLRMTRHLVPKGRGKLFYLKGGELADELRPVRERFRVHELAPFFKEEFFATKKVVEVDL